MKRAPLAPKFYGGIFGAGSGGGAAAVAVQLIQAYITHKALDPAAVQAIYWAVPILGVAAGAYLAPHQPRADAAGTGGGGGGEYQSPYPTSNVTVTGTLPPVSDEKAEALRAKYTPLKPPADLT